MSQEGVLVNSNTSPIGAARFPITPFVVGPVNQAGYQTIQSAINAANAAGGGVVYIQPGTYTENLTLFNGVELYGTPAVSTNQGASTTVIGTHTPPTSGKVGFNTICWISSGDVFFSNAAGSTHMSFLNCESAIQSGYFLHLPNWTGILEIWDNNGSTAGAPTSVSDGGIFNTGGSTVLVFSAGVGSSTSIPMTLSGPLISTNGFFGTSINFVTGSTLTLESALIFGGVTFSNNTTGEISRSTIISGSSPSVTMSSSANMSVLDTIINSTNTPAISGSGGGILTLSGITYTNNASFANSLNVSSSPANLFGEVRAGKDTGGASGFTSITNNSSSTISSGTGTVKMSSTNNANNAAWIKIYIGTTAYWIPAWTTNAP